MSVLWQCSWDYFALGNLAQMSVVPSSIAAAAVAPTATPPVGYALSFSDDNSYWGKMLTAPDEGVPSLWGQFRVYIERWGGDGFFAIGDASQAHLVFGCHPSDVSRVYRADNGGMPNAFSTVGATHLGYGSVMWRPKHWYVFGFLVTIDASAGSIQTWINGKPDINLSGINTKGGARLVEMVSFTGPYSGYLGVYDDVIMGDTNGTNVEPPGDTRVDAMRPVTPNGTDRDWTRATETRRVVPHSPMLSLTTPAPLVSLASTEYDATSYASWKAFDGLTAQAANGWLAATSTGWVQIDLGSAVVISVYGLTSYSEVTRAPRNWTLQGSNNGTTFDTLDTRTGEVSWGSFETREYTIASPGSYRYYRLNVTLNNGDGYLRVQEFLLYETLSAGSDDFAMVDDVRTDTADWLSSSALGDRVSVRVAALTNAGGTIVAVQVTAHMTKYTPGDGGCMFYMLSNGVRYYSPEFFPVYGQWLYFHYTWDQHLYPVPEAWTEADFNACEFGVERTS